MFCIYLILRVQWSLHVLSMTLDFCNRLGKIDYAQLGDIQAQFYVRTRGNCLPPNIMVTGLR